MESVIYSPGGMEARDTTQLAEHLNASLERLPGPAYYQVLRWIHRILEPANYLEIGVYKGHSLAQVRPGTPTIGIDPDPGIEVELDPAIRIYELESDEFFARSEPGELLGGPVALAFIDGLHLFEQVLRDFSNVERHSSTDTVVLLHDCLPLDQVTASREATTAFYSGDVWKAALVLRRLRPELDMVTVRTAPTGLCLVRGLDSADRRLEEEMSEVESIYTDLDFDYYLAHRDEMPDEIENTPEAVGDWLRQSRAPQS
jgi:Methyltransferase domain